MNALKTKIKEGKKIKGTLVSLTDPCLCEIMGNAGYDCVWIDMEHTYMSYRDVLCHINAASSSGIASVVRLPQNDLTATKKILEMNPDGIIFPMVRSAKEAEELIKMTLYPPFGNRGFGPMRAIGYGRDDAKEYVEEKSFDLCRFIQIEHTDAVDELEKIIENPYIDGYIFGPNDLSGSAGEMMDVYGEKTTEAIEKAIKILKDNNKYFGFAIGFSEDDIKKRAEYNPDMIFAGADWTFVYSKSKDTLDVLNKFMED